MKTVFCEQKGAEWLAIREKCLTTGSDMGLWLTKNDKRSRDARMARICNHLSLSVEKDAWQLQQEEDEARRMSYNLPVQRGNRLEPQAREVYQMTTGNEVEEVGIILTDDDLFGFSPDGMIPSRVVGTPAWKKGLEIKSPWPDTHIEYLLAGILPEEYACQVHGGMVISEVDCWDFESFCPGWPPLIVEVKRDKFTDELAKGLEDFRKEYQECAERLADLESKFEPTRAKLSAIWAAKEQAA